MKAVHNGLFLLQSLLWSSNPFRQLPIKLKLPQVKCRLNLARRLSDSDNNPMREKYAKWIEFLYGPWFRVIGFFYRIYTSNRARYERFKSNQAISSVLKAATVLLLVGWIMVWLFAPEENRTRLQDEVRQTIGGFDADTDQ